MSVYVEFIEQDTNGKSSILYLYRHASGWIDGPSKCVKEVEVPQFDLTESIWKYKISTCIASTFMWIGYLLAMSQMRNSSRVSSLSNTWAFEKFQVFKLALLIGACMGLCV